jgi:hypothetical protein
MKFTFYSTLFNYGMAFIHDTARLLADCPSTLLCNHLVARHACPPATDMLDCQHNSQLTDADQGLIENKNTRAHCWIMPCHPIQSGKGREERGRVGRVHSLPLYNLLHANIVSYPSPT